MMNLCAANIAKAYDGRPVLSDCSYSFGAPGTYVLMGPNGSGKSTFLRICALLERPDAGLLTFTDRKGPLSPDVTLRRRMTLVLPRTVVFNSTVSNNVAYGLQVRGMHGHSVREKVQAALAYVDLYQREKQNARTLSSGETQRLALARALAIDPEILFLDEPTASVDEENTAIIESIIGRLRNDGHTKVIMTTHDRDQAERLADRILLLRQGRLFEAGSR